MNHPLPKPIHNLLLSLTLLLLVVSACKFPDTNSAQPSDFNFAVSVRDINRGNKPIGQAVVKLEVGNETVAQEVTDNSGQANFTVSSRYLNKTGRLYAEAHNYHPEDIVLVLRDNIRQAIPLVSADSPKLGPDPVEPRALADATPKRSPTPKETRPEIENFEPGESKTGDIAEGQTIDYRFEATKNAPLILKASVSQPVGPPMLVINLEIYDAHGFFIKDWRVYGSGGETRFTPQDTGSYILRIRGQHSFGKYLVFMQEQ